MRERRSRHTAPSFWFFGCQLFVRASRATINDLKVITAPQAGCGINKGEAAAREKREEDKERLRAKQMVLVGILSLAGGITGLLLDHYLFDDMQLLMIVSFMLMLFGIANVVYGMFRNPDRKKKREERKNQQATA